MNCPRCGKSSEKGHPACSHCGFSLQGLVQAFGTDLIELKRLADDAHCLRLQEARAVDHILEAFEERFPQVFFTVYFGVLPPLLSVNELAFLLLNRGVFSEDIRPKLNEHAIALIIDPETRNVGMMAGYALEKLLTPRRIRRILRSVRTPLWHNEYVGSIGKVVSKVEQYLRKGAERRWRRQTMPPPSTEEFMAGSGLRSLRSPAKSSEEAGSSAFHKHDPGEDGRDES